MACKASPKGVTVIILDEKGNEASRHRGASAVFTGQRAKDREGTREWLKQVYVAEDTKRINGLKKLVTADGAKNVGCSACSKRVTVCVHENAPAGSQTHIFDNRFVIAEGNPIMKRKHKVLEVHTLKVSPIEICEGHPLRQRWLAAVEEMYEIVKDDPDDDCDKDSRKK